MPKPNLQTLNQGALWSKKLSHLDPQTDKAYIIHQTLMYSPLEELPKLFQIYPPEEVKKVFTTQPLAIYTPAAFNFIKNLVLRLDKVVLDESAYVKTSLRDS